VKWRTTEKAPKIGAFKKLLCVRCNIGFSTLTINTTDIEISGIITSRNTSPTSL
jgi:hypothetical protein